MKKYCLLLAMLFILLLVLVPRAGHGGDVHYWFSWACYILEHGLGNVYQVPDNNYNPLYHYILWVFGKLMGSTSNIDYYRHWLKAFTLVFDFAGAIWAASLVRERNQRLELTLLLLLNIGYLYNTLVWEQVDSIFTFFAFVAVVLAVQLRVAGSMVCFVLALMTKTQAVIFLPPLLLLWIPLWWQRPKQLLWGSAATITVLLVVLAPFIWGGWENYLPRIIEINFNATKLYPILSVNAYNIWHLTGLVHSVPNSEDTYRIAGVTCRMWGLIMFFAFSGLALYPLLAAGIRQLQIRYSGEGQLPVASRAAGPGLQTTLLSIGLIPLLFAFFNTQMHERYWHAAILFLAAYSFVSRDYWLYIVVSVAYFLNLEGVLQFLQLRNYGVVLFKPQLIASLFAGAILLGLFRLYRPVRQQSTQVIVS